MTLFTDREMMMKRLILTLALLPAFALAGNKPEPPKQEPVQPIAVAGSTSGAIAGASAHSASNAVSGAHAQGGDATAFGGKGGEANAAQHQVARGGDQSQQASSNASNAANNEGNTLSVTNDYPRQAPSTSQGSLMIGSCGAAGNGGGSNSRGSAFLGLAWTPADCKLLLAASAYQSLGMYDSACEMVNGISTVRARWKKIGREAPSCEVKPPVPVVAPPIEVNVEAAAPAPAIDTSNFATKDYVNEVWKRSVSK